MTRHSTPTIIALVSMTIVGCQPHSSSVSDSSTPTDDSPNADTLGSDLNNDWDASHTKIEPSDIGMQGPITGPATEPRPTPSLHCTTENLHLSSTPNAIRVELSRGEDQDFFHYKDAPVHPDTFADPTQGIAEMSGVLDGEWTDESLNMWMTHTDESGSTHFGMFLERDHRTQGVMYSGLAYLQGCAAFEMTCWDPSIEPDFLYDSASGDCLDENGELGTNPWPLHMVRETGDGECTQLTGVSLNEDDYGYPNLAAWNLRGAVLDGSAVHFANLVDADLEGTDMAEFGFGYAEITGSIDTHTQLPLGPCDVGYTGDLHCWN